MCRTCHTFCRDKACPTCEHACVSFGRCCLQTFCRSPQTHTGTASLLEEKEQEEEEEEETWSDIFFFLLRMPRAECVTSSAAHA